MATLQDRQFANFQNDPVRGWVSKTETTIADSQLPLPVTVTTAESGEVVSNYGEALSVANGATATISSYSVPMGKFFHIQFIEVGGSNIATYHVEINGVVQARKRTWFAGGLNEKFDFIKEANRGLRITAGDQITVHAVHSRPSAGDFEARIVGVLADD